MMPSRLPATTRSRRLSLRCDGLLKRHFGQRERGRSASQGEHVGIMIGVSRKHEGDDLGFVVPTGREERPNRTIDDAAGQHFLFRSLAFALEEAAGDAPRRIRIFAIVHGERQKVDAHPRGRGVTRGDEHHGVALPDNDGSVRLLGQLAGLNGQGVLADLNLTLVHMASMGSRSPVR
jgi:hypothetical protein